MALNRRLTSHGHVRRLVVMPDPKGWEVLEKEDSEVLMRLHRDDWHRVERDVRLFEIRVLALKREGWIDLPTEDRGHDREDARR